MKITVALKENSKRNIDKYPTLSFGEPYGYVNGFAYDGVGWVFIDPDDFSFKSQDLDSLPDFLEFRTHVKINKK